MPPHASSHRNRSSDSILPPSSPPTASSSTSGASPSRQLAAYKRKIRDLEEELLGASKKKKVAPPKPGRGIRKIVDLFADLKSLVSASDAALLGEVDEDVDGMNEEEKEARATANARALRSHNALKQLIPDFDSHTRDGDPTEYYAMLQRAANDARSDDLNGVRAIVAEWVNTLAITSGTGTMPVYLNPRHRENRGIQHDTCGRLLCPISYDWDNSEVRQKIRDCAPGFELGDFFVRALYLKHTGSTEKIQDGYLQSDMLVQVYKYIFTSPSSANFTDPEAGSATAPTPTYDVDANQGNRRNVATTLGMDSQVTPRAIAYAAVQLVFALSCAPSWRDRSEGLNFRDLYYFIVDYFEDFKPTGQERAKKRANDLLRWWNFQVFPGASARVVPKCNARDLLRSQRESDESQDSA